VDGPAAGCLGEFRRLGGHRLLVERVDLGEAEQLRLLGQAVAVAGEFRADGAVGARHVLLGAVDEVDQGGAALDVAEELVAQALALVRPLDQPGMSAIT
jgi:hypothetical protein